MQNKNDENEVVTKGYLREELKIFGNELRADLKAEFKSEMNSLAVIINGAFANQQKYMDKKFDEVDNRFDRVETRLDKVEYKVDVLQDQMELVNKRQVKTEKRIEKLETATI